MSLDWDGASVVSGQDGPYPVRDSSFGSQTNALAAEFSLSDQRTWAGFEVPLGDDGALMEQAGEIEIPFRFYGFNAPPPPDFTLVLQIGSLSGEDLGFIENPELIMEKVLYPPPPGALGINPAAFDSNARLVRIILSGEDRRKLGGATHLRLIAVHAPSAGAGTIQGRVLLAPPIIHGAGFRPIIVRGNQIKNAAETGGSGFVRGAEIRESGANTLGSKYGDILDRLHPSGSSQQVLSLSWSGLPAGEGAGADGRTGALPLQDYQSLSFFIKGPTRDTPDAAGDYSITDGTLRFMIARGPESLSRTSEQYLEAEIPLQGPAGSTFAPGEWSRVVIRYRGKDQGISVGGRDVSGSHFKYRQLSRNSSVEGAEGRSGYIAVFADPGTAASLPDGNFLFDEIILEDSTPRYRLNGGTSVEYTRPGVLISAGDTELLSDLSLSTALESEVQGNPFVAESEVLGGAVSRSGAAFTLLGAKLTGNLTFTAAEDTFLWNAGHGISRNWGAFSVGESFSASPGDMMLDHRFGLGFASVFHTSFDAEAYYEDESLERKWNFSIGVNPPPDYIPSLSIDTVFQWFENTDEPSQWPENYGVIWTRSWEPMTPDLGEDASSRETRSVIRLSENTKPVGAELTLEGITGFVKSNNITRSGNMVRLDVPVTLGDSSLNFQMERGFKRNLRFSGENALGEGEKFAEGISDALPLWGVFPFYSIFAPELNDAMDKSLENSPSGKIAEHTSFNDRFGFSARFPAVYDYKAFFIPSGAGGRLERVLEQKLDTRLDVLYLNGNLNFGALNMFGAFGMYPLFNFYQSDDFSHNLETAIAIPAEEEISWRIQSGFGAGFRGFAGGELGLANTITAGSSGWVESLSADWTVPTKKSLLSVFYNWIAGAARTQSSWLVLSDLLNTNYEQLRKESLEMSFDHNGDYLTWSIIIGHESIIRILGRLNFSVFAKFTSTQNEQTEVLSFIGTVGTTLNVSF
jgi:hypothetical protein